MSLYFTCIRLECALALQSAPTVPLFQQGKMVGCFAAQCANVNQYVQFLVHIGQYLLQLCCLTFQIAWICSSPTPTESAMIACFAQAPRPDERKDPRPALLRAVCLPQKLSKEPHDTVGTSDAFDQLVLANIISMHSFEKRYYAPICSI